MDWGLFPVGDWLWVSRGLSFLGEDLKTPAVYFPRRTSTELLFNNFPRPVSLFRVQDMSPNWSCGQVSKLQAGIVYIPARRSYASFDSSFSTSALDRGSGSPSIVGLPDCPLPWSLAPPNRLSWLLPRTEPKSGNGAGRSAVERSLNIGRPASKKTNFSKQRRERGHPVLGEGKMPSLPGGRSYGLARWEGGLPALHEDRMSSFPARVPCASARRPRRLRQEPLPLFPITIASVTE